MSELESLVARRECGCPVDLEGNGHYFGCEFGGADSFDAPRERETVEEKLARIELKVVMILEALVKRGMA